jgi:predicted membrane chloride channel (bestrophin family)
VLARCSNRPLFVANTLARELRAIPTSEALDFSSRERLFLMAMVNDLSACVGACERIVQTPVPTQYARHTSRFLCLWIFTLPLLLLPEMGFWVVPAVACVSWTLFGIQELGLQIENPFDKNFLRLDALETMHRQAIDETLALVPEYELTRSESDRPSDPDSHSGLFSAAERFRPPPSGIGTAMP